MRYTSCWKILLACFILYAFQANGEVAAQSGDNGVEEVTLQNNEVNTEETTATTTINDELTTENNIESSPCNCGDTTTVKDNDETTLLPEVEATTNSDTVPVETTEAVELPIVCSNLGNLPNSKDCRRYYTCAEIPGSVSLEAIEKSCSTGKAFSVEFSSCMLDLSPCSIEAVNFECVEAGSFAVPANETTQYYRCVPHLDGRVSVFHKYLIKCGEGTIFMPLLGKCFFDFNNPNNIPGYGFINNGLPDDEQLVKAEMKQWKMLEKSKLKAEKKRLKYEKKLQKEIEKKANKEAKEKSKSTEESKEVLL